MSDFNIWLVGSILLVILGWYFTFRKSAFGIEVFNFIAFVSAIGYIILKRYTYWSWALIPLIWLAGIIVAAVLLLLSQKREANKKKQQIFFK
jgi:phosphoglycerol transferase MdoB-like AlkP superfamily enzyme